MKKIITLDVIGGLIFTAVSFYFQYIDIDILLIAMMFFCLLVVIFANFISIFTMWGKYKYFSFVPFAVSLAFFPLVVLSGSIGHKIGMYNNPPYYDKYFSEERKKELTTISQELLQAPDEKARQAIEEKLTSHRLVVRHIDRHSNVVEFNYYRSRVMFTYIFAKDGLPEIYSTRPVITEDDIHCWDELADIVKTENNPLKYSCDNIVFAPEISYPSLINNIDKAFADKLAAMESYGHYAKRNKFVPKWDTTGKRYVEYLNLIANQLSKEEKLKVIEMLNQQCQISSGLVEDSNIFWKLEREQDCLYSSWSLRFGKCGGVGTSFWVGKHLKQLISDGVISVKDEEGHLQLKSNLNDREIREIEWLQVEMMDFIYGNLVHKTEYWSNGKTKLADNWYFYVNCTD